MRVPSLCVAALLMAAPARAEIAADALARYEAAGAEIAAVFGKAKSAADIPTLRDPRFAPALRTLFDPALFVAPLTAADADAMQRIAKAVRPVITGYENATAAVLAQPSRDAPARLQALAEVAALLLAFTVHEAAANADVLADGYVTNPGKATREQRARGAGFAHRMAVDAVRSAAHFAGGRNWPDQRRVVLEALDTTMVRIASILPPARRDEARALLKAAAQNEDPDQRAMIGRIVDKLRDAPCNLLCKRS